MPAHSGPRLWLLPTAAAVSVGLAGWTMLTASRELARSFSIFLYLLANLIVFLDAFDFCLRIYFQRMNASTDDSGEGSPTSVALPPRRFTAYQKRLHLQPWALVVSVHNAEDGLDDFLEAMEALRERVWIIDDGSDDSTYLRLRQAGWRCLEGGQNRKKPGAIRTLLGNLPPEIETVVVVDPDIAIRSDAQPRLEEAIFDFQRSGMAALCPRIVVREDGFLARFQALEYCLAFCLGRKSLADHSVNSGISIYRRSALAAELEKHSLSAYAEDFENSMLLLGAGERIYYDSRIVVETEGKRTWPSWFSQRVGWAFGLIKVYFERFGDIRRVAARDFNAKYQFLVYLGILNLLFQPLKLLSFGLLLGSFAQGLDSLLGLRWLPYWRVTDPVYFLAAFSKYAVLTFAAILVAVPRGEKSYLLPVGPLYFFYALAQVIPTTVGYANWWTLRIWGRRLVRDHYQDEAYFIRHYGEKCVARRLRRLLWPSPASE